MKRIMVTILVVMVTLCFACISFAIDQNDEIVSMRTKYAKTYDNRDGSYTTKVYLKPIHKQDELGNWVDINLARIIHKRKRGVVQIDDKQYSKRCINDEFFIQ